MKDKNFADIPTLNVRIIEYLGKNPDSTISEMANALDKTQSHISVTVLRLLKEGYIKRTSYGHYSLPNRKNDDRDIRNSIKDNKNSNYENELQEELIKLKEKYGKEEVLKAMKRLIRIME